MWVSVPTVVLLAVVAVHNVVGEIEPPLTVSQSNAPAAGQGRKKVEPVTSLEYKPIKPSYLSSGSNVAQIIPPGQPWPANAAGYSNFSQVNPMTSTKLDTDDDVPLLQSAPTPSNANLINLDMSNPNTNFAEALEKVLAPEVTNIEISGTQQTIPTTLNITPPPNANMDFVKALQAAVRVALSKLFPSAGTSLRIAITKSSSGAIVNVKAYLDVIIPAAVEKVTLPPSAVPEIDLTKSSSGLLQNLQTILLKELSQGGYNSDSKSIQNFSLSFSILPPEGATKDYVKLYVLGPLQAVLKGISPRSAITSISVNTQESNNKILRQTVKCNVQIAPSPDFKMNKNIVEIPEIELKGAGTNVINTVITTLQNQITKNVAVNPTQAKTLSIPFKITPPAGTTQQQIQDLYITPISKVLSKLDPTGKILKINEKTLPNGDIIIIIYMNIPSNATTSTSSNGQIQPVVVPVVPQTTSTPKPTTATEEMSTKAQTHVNINNRNAIPEGEEDELPEFNEESSESSESETSAPLPSNAIRTSVVDLTTPTASVKNIQRILDEELSPLSNPVDDDQPKILAIPFRMKPPAGSTLQQIENNVVVPIGKLLSTLEPTGDVITSRTKPLPNGEVESVVYFNIPSVADSETYKIINNELDDAKSPTIIAGESASSELPVTPRAAQEQVISPVTRSPQTQIPNIELPQNIVKTSPIDLSQPNFDVLKNGIEERLNEAIMSSKPSQNGEPQTIGFSFVVPKNQATRIPIMAQAIATLLKGLVPSGKAVPVLSPEVLPNGDVEFTIYYEVPTTGPKEDLANEQSNKNIASKIPKVVPESKHTQSQNEVEPENAIIVAPIDMKQPNFDTIANDIERRVNEVRKTSNGQPQVIGIPFILPTNQKPSYILTHTLKMALQNFIPSGNIVQVGEPKTLANGETEFIIYEELPAITNEEPSKQIVGEQTKPSVAPMIPKITPAIEKPQTEEEVPPKNAVMVAPLAVTSNIDQLRNDIERRVNDVRKTSKGQPQVIGFPFILPNNQKPSFFLRYSLKMALQNFIPSGNIVQIGEPKTLPNGDTEFVIYDELPATTNEKPSDEGVEEQTKPAVASSTPTVTPLIEQPQIQKEVPPKNAVLVAPLIITPDFDQFPSDIERRVSEFRKSSNGEPRVIGFTFIFPNNQKPSFFVTHALKMMLENCIPSGTIVQVSEPETLPNGNTQLIIYDELPAITNEKPREEVVEEQTTSSVATLTPEVMPENKQIKNQNDITPNNAIITLPIDLKKPDFGHFAADIQRKINEMRKTSNGPSQVIGIRFISPKDSKPNHFAILSLKTLLRLLVPSGNIVQVTEPKTLPNGDNEFIIYDEIPTPTKEKFSEEVVEEQTKPSVPPTKPKITPENKQTQKHDDMKPKNAIITSPIDLKQPNSYADFPADIQRKVDEVIKSSNGQSKVIGIPFILPNDQKPSFFLTHSLKTVLKALVPSGNIVQVTEPKTLPNGDNEFIIYDELPAITKEKPSEELIEKPIKPSVSSIISKVTSENEQPQEQKDIKPQNNSSKELLEKPIKPSVSPIISKVTSENEQPQEQKDIKPKNSIKISPIDLKQPNSYADFPADIQRKVNEVMKSSNGQPQVIGIPFILPKDQKPSFFLTHSLKTVLGTLLPSGKIVQVTEPKTLPNGDNEFIIYDELPASTNEKPCKKEVVEIPKPTVEPLIPELIPENKQSMNQDNMNPEGAISTSPIDLKQANNYADLPAAIQRKVNEVRKDSNGQSQIIGIPFVLPKNQKPSSVLTHSLKTVLTTVVPSGKIVKVTEPKTLPNGDYQFTIYDDLPAVTNEKPTEKVVEKQGRSLVENRNQNTDEPIVFPTAPEVSNVVSKTKIPKIENELQPENAIIAQPIDLKKLNFNNVQENIQQIINKISKTSDGQAQVLGIPFVISKNLEPSIVFLEEVMKKILSSVLPSAKILPVPQPNVLPNGDFKFIIYTEIPGVQSKNNKIVEKKVPAVAVEDVNLDEPGASVQGEVGKALTKAISTISTSSNNLNKPANLKFNIYAPLENSLSQNKKLINEVSSELNSLEPNAKIVTVKTNEHPQSNEPDGVVEITIPSIASSKTAQNLKNALKIPTINVNIPELKLVDTIKDQLQNGLKSVGQLNPKGSQLFNLNFRLNPFDTKGSVSGVLKALKGVDPKGQIASYKIRSGPDGLEYLDVVYLIPKLEDSIIYKVFKPETPEVIYASFVNIDSRNPSYGLLQNVVKEVGAAEDEVQGAKEGQLVELPLDFRFINSKGLSDSKVSEIISKTLPTIQGYISQILPDGKIISIDTVTLAKSDDVVLKIVVRTPYEPDNTIVIEDVRPKARTVVTTPKPKSRGLFGVFGL